MLNALIFLVLVVLFAALAMWVVKRFAEELGGFLTKLFTTAIVVFVVIAFVLCVLGMFGIAGVHLPHLVGS